MVSLVWDGTGLFLRDNQLVIESGECCCCQQSCPIPSGCDSVIWAQCSGTNCIDYNFSSCLTNISAGLIDQGYSVLEEGNYCCHCSGFYLKDVYGCCSGTIEIDGLNDLLIPANTINDCALCSGIMIISLEEIDGEYFWRIPRCGGVYYCILEE